MLLCFFLSPIDTIPDDIDALSLTDIQFLLLPAYDNKYYGLFYDIVTTTAATQNSTKPAKISTRI
jgi:hypothetical protein